MLTEFHVNLVFTTRTIVILKTSLTMTHEDICVSLGLEPFDGTSTQMLVDRSRPKREQDGPEILVILDKNFSENGEFGIPSDEKGLIEISQCFSEKLYELSSENYREIAQKIYSL